MTREDILDEAGTIIRDEGYEMLTISNLAEKLNVKKASLYYHFESKDMLISALYDYFNEKLAHRGFRIDFSLDSEEILSKTYEHWREIFLSDELSCGLSLIEQRKEVDERAYEIYNSLHLMLRSQSDAVMENLVSRNKFKKQDSALLGELFASASFLRLTTEHSYEDDRAFISAFTNLFAT